ncbi:MAG: hypothetical protein Q8M83_02195 [bacterium]|nr:hypothetical protein [bacterium]
MEEQNIKPNFNFLDLFNPIQFLKAFIFSISVIFLMEICLVVSSNILSLLLYLSPIFIFFCSSGEPVSCSIPNFFIALIINAFFFSVFPTLFLGVIASLFARTNKKPYKSTKT